MTRNFFEVSPDVTIPKLTPYFYGQIYRNDAILRHFERLLSRHLTCNTIMLVFFFLFKRLASRSGYLDLNMQTVGHCYLHPLVELMASLQASLGQPSPAQTLPLYVRRGERRHQRVPIERERERERERGGGAASGEQG